MIGPFDRPGRLAAQRGTRGHVPCQARGLGSRVAKPSGGGIANGVGFWEKTARSAISSETSVGRRWLFNLFSSVQKATKCLEAKRLAKRDSA